MSESVQKIATDLMLEKCEQAKIKADALSQDISEELKELQFYYFQEGYNAGLESHSTKQQALLERMAYELRECDANITMGKYCREGTQDIEQAKIRKVLEEYQRFIEEEK